MGSAVSRGHRRRARSAARPLCSGGGGGAGRVVQDARSWGLRERRVQSQETVRNSGTYIKTRPSRGSFVPSAGSRGSLQMRARRLLTARHARAHCRQPRRTSDRFLSGAAAFGYANAWRSSGQSARMAGHSRLSWFLAVHRTRRGCSEHLSSFVADFVACL